MNTVRGRGTLEMNKDKYFSLASLSLPGDDYGGGKSDSPNMAAFGVRVGDALSSSVSVDVAMSLKNPPPRLFQAETDQALRGESLKEEIKKRLEVHEERLDSFLNWGTRKTGRHQTMVIHKFFFFKKSMVIDVLGKGSFCGPRKCAQSKRWKVLLHAYIMCVRIFVKQKSIIFERW